MFEEEIMKIAKEVEYFRVSLLEKILGIKKTIIRDALKKLIKEGKIEKFNRWTYKIKEGV